MEHRGAGVKATIQDQELGPCLVGTLARNRERLQKPSKSNQVAPSDVFLPHPPSFSSPVFPCKIRLSSSPSPPLLSFLLFQTEAALCEGGYGFFTQIFNLFQSTLLRSLSALFALACNRILFWKAMQKSDSFWIWPLFLHECFSS